MTFNLYYNFYHINVTDKRYLFIITVRAVNSVSFAPETLSAALNRKKSFYLTFFDVDNRDI